jgi:two-component system alkaline phosphatase synthesis response regulator PhoP
MAGEKILVVDDEANIRELARMYLEKEGFDVLTAGDGQAALDLARSERPALMVLDLMLPKVDGWEVCRRIRANSTLPIIMLTARDDDVDKIVGLELGADDYMTKPFNPRELVARSRAILRRSSLAAGGRYTQVRRLGDLEIDPAGRAVTVGKESVALRNKEFDLLLTLVDHANTVLTREQLLDQVWGFDYYGETRTVDVHIAHLRDKLKSSNIKIETVWGVGYKLSYLS